MVERIGVVADKPPDKRRTDRRLKDPVPIGLRARVVARMELVSDLMGVPDAHSGRQKVVERLEQVRARDRTCSLKIGHLARGVRSRVRPAGTPKLDRLYDQLLDRRLQTLLDSGQIGLALPPVEIGAVIGDNEADVLHARAVSNQLSTISLQQSFIMSFQLSHRISHRRKESEKATL